MNAETYDDLKQYVGSKNDFTTDLLNMGYTKGRRDGYNQALEDFAEEFKAHCRKFTTKSISDADVDWIKNKLITR